MSSEFRVDSEWKDTGLGIIILFIVTQIAAYIFCQLVVPKNTPHKKGRIIEGIVGILFFGIPYLYFYQY